MKYKTELHCHTNDVSPCSEETAEEVVKKYLDAKYDSLVITNHYKDWIVNNLPGETFADRVDFYFEAVDKVRDAADGKLYVIPGMEITFNECANDYLVFGIKPEHFRERPDVFDMGIANFFRYADELGLLVIQAHPLRFGLTLTSPDELHGYEVFNGHQGQRSHNDVTEVWVKHFFKHDLILTSGSDNHHKWQTPTAGILTDAPITDNDCLMRVLRSRDYELIRTPLGDVDY